MEHLGLTEYLANPDVWKHLAIKENDQEGYEHMILYADNDLVVSDKDDYIIRNQVGKCFAVKKEGIGLHARC